MLIPIEQTKNVTFSRERDGRSKTCCALSHVIIFRGKAMTQFPEKREWNGMRILFLLFFVWRRGVAAAERRETQKRRCTKLIQLNLFKKRFSSSIFSQPKAFLRLTRNCGGGRKKKNCFAHVSVSFCGMVFLPLARSSLVRKAVHHCTERTEAG